jgi:hypothetical protein
MFQQSQSSAKQNLLAALKIISEPEFQNRKRNPHLLSCLKIIQNSAEKIKPQVWSSHLTIIVVHAHKFAVDINKGPSNPSLTGSNGKVVSSDAMYTWLNTSYSCDN